MAFIGSIVVWCNIGFDSFNASSQPLNFQLFIFYLQLLKVCVTSLFEKCSQFFPIGFLGFLYQDAGE